MQQKLFHSRFHFGVVEKSKKCFAKWKLFRNPFVIYGALWRKRDVEEKNVL
jgi:hypothetical protein